MDYEETFNLSYWRALRSTVDGVSFIDSFYQRFLAKSNEIADLFAATDFAVQKQMLSVSLMRVATFDPAQGPDAIMLQLAQRHRDLGVRSHLYELWLESLLDAVQSHDPAFDEQVGEAWRRQLAPGMAFMMSECPQ